jgi:hypothetical protein
MSDDPRWGDDRRDRDDGARDLSRGSRGGSDARERDQVDPRDVFMEHVDLPRGRTANTSTRTTMTTRCAVLKRAR